MKVPATGASRTPTKAAKWSCRRRGFTSPRSGAVPAAASAITCCPATRSTSPGDTIQRPPSGGGGSGSEGSPDGEGEDDFRFALSRDEFVDLFLEDLELPDLAKRRVVNAEALVYHRAGYSVSGSPANLALNRTVRNSMSRRIALRRPKPEELQALLDEIEALDPADEDKRIALEEEYARKKRRTGIIPYIDPLDVRYRRFEAHPKPVAQAVMFCLMDVSGSMTEHMKDLAKRFYVLLYIFLKRRYKNVEVVFIRHTHQASEVDEETFFNSPETGGTVVSTALEEMQRVIDGALQPRQLEHLRRPGIGRRQHRQRQREDRRPAHQCSAAGLPVLCLSGSWPRLRALPAGLYPPGQRFVADLLDDHSGRRTHGDAQGRPSPGHLPGVQRIVREENRSGGRCRMSSTLIRAERPLFEGC